jgi:hypothetical protein
MLIDYNNNYEIKIKNDLSDKTEKNVLNEIDKFINSTETTPNDKIKSNTTTHVVRLNEYATQITHGKNNTVETFKQTEVKPNNTQIIKNDVVEITHNVEKLANQTAKNTTISNTSISEKIEQPKTIKQLKPIQELDNYFKGDVQAIVMAVLTDDFDFEEYEINQNIQNIKISYGSDGFSKYTQSTPLIIQTKKPNAIRYTLLNLSEKSQKNNIMWDQLIQLLNEMVENTTSVNSLLMLISDLYHEMQNH